MSIWRFGTNYLSPIRYRHRLPIADTLSASVFRRQCIRRLKLLVARRPLLLGRRPVHRRDHSRRLYETSEADLGRRRQVFRRVRYRPSGAGTLAASTPSMILSIKCHRPRNRRRAFCRTVRPRYIVRRRFPDRRNFIDRIRGSGNRLGPGRPKTTSPSTDSIDKVSSDGKSTTYVSLLSSLQAICTSPIPPSDRSLSMEISPLRSLSSQSAKTFGKILPIKVGGMKNRRRTFYRVAKGR